MGLRFDTGDSAFYDSGKTIKDNRLRDSLEKEEPRVKSFGERLRREREMRGVSLDEIAHTTKIGTRLLKALEDEQFELLPGGIFNKGFVRAYAKYLGIDEEQAVAAYLEAAGEREPDVRAVAEQNSRWDKGNILDNRPPAALGIPCRSGFNSVRGGCGGVWGMAHLSTKAAGTRARTGGGLEHGRFAKASVGVVESNQSA